MRAENPIISAAYHFLEDNVGTYYPRDKGYKANPWPIGSGSPIRTVRVITNVVIVVSYTGFVKQILKEVASYSKALLWSLTKWR